MWCSYKYPCQSSLVCDAVFASIADCGQVAAAFVSLFTMKTYKQTDGERDVRHPQSKHVAFFGSFSRCCWQFTGGSDEPEKLSFTQPKKTRSWKVCLGLKVPKLKLTPVDGVTDFLQTVYVKIRQTWNKKFPCYFSNNLMFIWSSAVSQTDIKARANIKYNIEWPSVFSGGPLKLSFSTTVHSLLLLNAILTGPCQSTWVQRQSWAAGPVLIPFAPTHGVDSAAWDQTLLLFWNNTRLNLLYVTRLCSLIEHIYLEIKASQGVQSTLAWGEYKYIYWMPYMESSDSSRASLSTGLHSCGYLACCGFLKTWVKEMNYLLKNPLYTLSIYRTKYMHYYPDFMRRGWTARSRCLLGVSICIDMLFAACRLLSHVWLDEHIPLVGTAGQAWSICVRQDWPDEFFINGPSTEAAAEEVRLLYLICIWRI